MSTLCLPTKKVMPAPSAPTPPPALAVAAAPERTPKEKAEWARLQPEHDGKAHQESKYRRDKRTSLGLATLRRRWPELFTTPVPLAVGVRPQIRVAMPEMPSAQLSDVMQFWTRGSSYLQAIAAGVERRNLDGSPAGEPDERQREFAQDMLRRRGKWPAEGAQNTVDAPEPAEHPESDPT